jgi:hypothetical protein
VDVTQLPKYFLIVDDVGRGVELDAPAHQKDDAPPFWVARIAVARA